MSLLTDLKFCLKPCCPVCRGGRLFRPFSITVVDACSACGEKLSAHDVGDGASVFLLFILCFSIIPMAWGVELLIAPPLWAHVVLWGIVGLGMIGVLLPAVKAYIILLEYRHRR